MHSSWLASCTFLAMADATTLSSFSLQLWAVLCPRLQRTKELGGHGPCATGGAAAAPPGLTWPLLGDVVNMRARALAALLVTMTRVLLR
eukprot:9352337-Pyramimonas_sp.AAC.1